MFWAATAFNFVIGFPIWLAPKRTFRISFREAVTAGAARHWSDFGFAVVLVGLGYAFVARDVTRNRGIVWLGVFAKLFDVIVLSSRAAAGIARPLVLLPAGADGIFTILFVLFLRTGIGREHGVPNFPERASFARGLHEVLLGLTKIERRFDPFFRPAFDRLFREPLARMTQAVMNSLRTDEGLALAEEKPLPEEEALVARIIADMGAYMRDHYKPGGFERGGNTKTHGVVRAEFVVRDNLPAHLRCGIFAAPRTFRAWVRFGGPGPASPPDIEDVGVLSIGIKLMGVPGPKLLDDEKFTQDFTGISAPTFTTPDIRENTKLQLASRRGLPLFYFIRPGDSHLLDGIMQGLWARTQTSPLETEYWSCVPYLLGEGQAMQYMLRPRSERCSDVPNLPGRPPDNYLREAMAATLHETAVEFDFLVQVQTDPHRMPVENACVRWPAELSRPVTVAILRIPAQQFDSPAQLAFAHYLSFNPWHCLAEHRPLGNQNRARREIYQALSRLRQSMNQTPHREPTGEETFEAPPTQK
jgi:hypothetical protein